jgi:hypothetical protein
MYADVSKDDWIRITLNNIDLFFYDIHIYYTITFICHLDMLPFVL